MNETLNALQQSYAPHIARVEQIMAAEIENWEWEFVPQMKNMVLSYLGRSGKRLRPLLSLIFCDLYSGSFEKISYASAAIETYHTATLIYDDIQDNSEFRRGLPCAHVTASTSMAMNQAGAIRSLMYHMIHRCNLLSMEEKNETHKRIDKAATLVSLGQSIDIGWHEGWYKSYQDFPYEKMIAWKTAALFSCAAYLGAFLAKANPEQTIQAENWGKDIGILFQIVDDYHDVFGNPAQRGRPLNDDFREGKLTAPVIYLLNDLSSDGKSNLVSDVLEQLSRREAKQFEWGWLTELMIKHKIDQQLQTEFSQRIAALRAQADELGTNTNARESLRLFTDILLTPTSSAQSINRGL